MHCFKDCEGRTWIVSVNIDAARRVRSELGVNLVSSDITQTIDRLLNDLVLFCDVLFCLVQADAKERAVTSEAFGRAMAGDAIDSAIRALLEELADFTPNPRDRARVQKVVATLFDVAESQRNLADAQLDEALKKLCETTGPISGDAPAQSESTRGR